MSILKIFLITLLCYYILLELFRYLYQDKRPPKLEEIKLRFMQGKPPRKFHRILRAYEPVAMSYYCKAPGRLTCAIQPYDVNGEKIWQLIVGFRETADSKPTKFIQIPVYSDGQLYDA
jgi:hypothetical protein